MEHDSSLTIASHLRTRVWVTRHLCRNDPFNPSRGAARPAGGTSRPPKNGETFPAVLPRLIRVRIVVFWLHADRTLIVKPVFDQQGSVVAWLSGDSLLDASGNLVAFLDGATVYSCEGADIGFFEDGYFWEANGRAVAFIDKAIGGPDLPFTSIPPFPPIDKAGVVPPARRRKQDRSLRTTSWSTVRWPEYVRIPNPRGHTDPPRATPPPAT